MSKLTTLKGKDPKEVARLLSLVSKSILPNPELENVIHPSGVDTEFVKDVLAEILQYLKIPEGDLSAQTRSRIYAFLSEEISEATLGNANLSRLKSRMSDEESASDRLAVFISYAHKDNESPDPGNRWLDRLNEYLQPLVLQNQVSAWSDTQIEIGESWQESIKSQLNNAKVAVLLVSPAFLASKYIRNSELPVLLMNAQNRGVIVLPIILRRCLFTATKFKYPNPVYGPAELSLSTFQAANPPDKPLNAMREHEQDEVLASIAERILKIAQQTPAAYLPDANPGYGIGGARDGAPPIWNIPHPRNPFFTGRTHILDQVHRALVASGKAALSGMGGTGKTQTAVEYAYRHRGEYSAVLWAKADTEESLKSDYAIIAGKLNLPEKDETEKDIVIAAVTLWLEGHSDWLLILDNADNLGLVSDLMRREWGGHILITTRAHATGGVNRVEISEMTAEEGSLLLLRRAKLISIDDGLESATESDQAYAAEITQEVRGLPLALDQAGAFIEEMSSSLDEYLELYAKEGAILRAARGVLAVDHQPVTITFSLALRQVEEASAAAADMLRVCSFLAPASIPEEIFSEGAAELGENLAQLAGGGINLVKVISEAGRFSLIRRDAKGGAIEIHRLVQQVLKDEMDEETRRLWAERVVRGLNLAFPKAELRDWPLCDKLLPHAQEAARLIGEYGLEYVEAARLLNNAGYYCTERGQFAEAESLFGRALAVYEKALGPEHLSVAASRSNLAGLYFRLGKFAEAESLCARALAVYEKALGPEHPDVATSLNNLATLYGSRGRHSEAESLFGRALRIREKILGPEHPDVATSLNNLANFYSGLGKFAEAESLFGRASAVYEKALGPEHPLVAKSLNNLASLYRTQGRHSEAEPLYVRALGILEKALGPEHPDVATTLYNLANEYERQGRHSEAGLLLERALRINEDALGLNHPDSSLVRETYNALLEKMRRNAQE